MRTKKHTKRIISLFVALAMVFALCGTAFAAQAQPLASSPETTGSITITDAEVGETYTIYQIFDLTYADDESSYSYKVVDAWSNFISEYTYTNSAGATVNLFDLDDSGYLKVDSNVFDEQDNSEVMAAFAQAALEYAVKNSISISGTQEATSDTVRFNDLSLGYYLVGTTLGSLCFLDSTNPDVSITEKNPTPSVDKEVYDSETDDEYTHDDTAEVGDTLTFEAFLKDVAHSSSLCMHDTLTDGLTFDNTSVKVYVGYPSEDVTDLFNDDTTTWTELTKGTEYTENDSCGDGCTFELSFDDDWLNSLGSGAVIKVTYAAVINEDAIDEDNLWAIQHNDIVLTFGANSTSTQVETSTDTVGFKIYKYTTTSEDGEEVEKQLDGAEFSLYRDANHTDIVYFIPISENGVIVGYEEVDPDTYTGSGTPTTTIVAGDVYVKGLHEGTYYLEETKAPDGYNKLTSDVTINITLTEDEEGYTETVTVDGTAAEDETAKIENNQGSILPGTGGIGTTIFYIIGIIIVAGVVVLLITRRRMNTAA